MKKIIVFLIIIIISLLIYTYIYDGDYIQLLFNANKEYTMSDVEKVDLKTLDTSEFFGKGIVTYNNQKIIYQDYADNIIWENESRVFTDNIYITDKYIYRCFENSVDIIDENNKVYTVTGITGKIITVSRENNKSYIITKHGDTVNLLYILNENYEVMLDNKQFEYPITGVSINNKSKGYCVNTFKIENSKVINSLSYNLLDDLQLWSVDIEDEAIIGLKIVNNNVIAIGTRNIYFYDINGNLMWKNSTYNKVKNFAIDDRREKIYILFEKNEKLELMCYGFEGKVKEVYKVPDNIKSFKIYDDKLYLYNSNLIGIDNDKDVNIIWNDKENHMIDFHVDNNNIYILSKNTLFKGKIKPK